MVERALDFNKIASTVLLSIDQEEPNCFGRSVKRLHPIFFGCYDWHSSVHFHWLMVELILDAKENNLSNEILEDLKKKLRERLTSTNMHAEATQINRYPSNWEVPYGFSWFLKLIVSLDKLAKFDDTFQQIIQNYQPLHILCMSRMKDWIKNLQTPDISGTHSNTAFGIINLLEYGNYFKDVEVIQQINRVCEKHYLPLMSIKDPPVEYEFLSPSLSAFELLSRFRYHSDSEIQEYVNKYFNDGLSFPLELKPIKDLDPINGLPCHLIGLNFARCWGLVNLSYFVDNKEIKDQIVQNALNHFNTSKAFIGVGEWMTDHWICTFAFKAHKSLKDCNAI